MSKRKSFAEATDSLLAAFVNGGGGAVNSKKVACTEKCF
jgi:hypothetical protein